MFKNLVKQKNISLNIKNNNNKILKKKIIK